MMMRASAGSALLLVAGVLGCLAAPMPAIATRPDEAAATKSIRGTSGKSAQHSRHLNKRQPARKHDRKAVQAAATQKSADKKVADVSGSGPPAIPDWVANANAQMNLPDAAPDSARAMSEAMTAKAGFNLLAAASGTVEAQVPADRAGLLSDPRNEFDQSLQETRSEQTVAIAPLRPASPPTAMASSGDGLDQASLIGKILIAVGALLTMASAARMLLA
jgi:hypothetical protein